MLPMQSNARPPWCVINAEGALVGKSTFAGEDSSRVGVQRRTPADVVSAVRRIKGGVCPWRNHLRRSAAALTAVNAVIRMTVLCVSDVATRQPAWYEPRNVRVEGLGAASGDNGHEQKSLDHAIRHHPIPRVFKGHDVEANVCSATTGSRFSEQQRMDFAETSCRADGRRPQ